MRSCLSRRVSGPATVLAGFLLAAVPALAVDLTWTSPIMLLGSAGGLIGTCVDVQSSFDNDFHIAMSVDPVDAIWYAHNSGSSWEAELAAAADLPAGKYFSLDTWGIYPIVVFVDETAGALRWTAKWGSSWSAPATIPDTADADYVRFKVDSFGVMHAAWVRDDGWLFHSFTSGSNWYAEMIADIPFWPLDPESMDMVLDSSGTPHFAWFDINAGKIKHAVRTGPYAFTIADVCDAVDVSWVRMEMMDPDLPFFTFLDHVSTSSSQIREGLKLGSSYYDYVVLATGPIDRNRIDIAFPEGEMITSSNIIWVYGTPSDFYYCHLNGSDYVTSRITQLDAYDRWAHMSAAWDADRTRVGLAIQDRGDQEVSWLFGNPVGVPTPTPTPTGARLRNISTRAQVNTGDEVTIGGFIIRNGTKQVVIRGLGPWLGTQGVTGYLANPEIQLYNGSGTSMAYNNDWGSLSAGDRSVLSANGLTPPNSAEAALVATLPAGAYTVHLRGAGGTTGVGLVEVYDVSTSYTCLLVNISTRAKVMTGDRVTIGGFIIQNGTKTVVLRGLGPWLGSQGVAGYLANPVIEVFNGSGTSIATNDNWGSLSAGDRSYLSSHGLTPPNSSEAALVLTLTAGPYTVHLRGSGSTTGVGLVEVYDGDTWTAAGAGDNGTGLRGEPADPTLWERPSFDDGPPMEIDLALSSTVIRAGDPLQVAARAVNRTNQARMVQVWVAAEFGAETLFWPGWTSHEDYLLQELAPGAGMEFAVLDAVWPGGPAGTAWFYGALIDAETGFLLGEPAVVGCAVAATSAAAMPGR